MAAMTIFERLDRGRPPAETAIKQPSKEPAQQMLDWLQRWPKPTVSSKEIYQYAPRSIRFDRENAIKTAEILAKHGWLTAIPTRQSNWRQWQIIRKGPIVHPTVAG
jgi:hypothetical protein